MRVDAVLVAAGRSTRFGEDKLLADLGGMPVAARALAALAAARSVRRIVVVASAERLEALAAIARETPGAADAAVVAGGERRRDSVEAGLRAAASEYVAIHDGARPLVTPALIDACAAAADGAAGAIPALPVTDSIKEVADGAVAASHDRSRLRAAQTPQVVRRADWLEAAARSGADETDDAAMLARAGLRVRVVEGDPANIKVTRPIDLTLARALLAEREGR